MQTSKTFLFLVILLLFSCKEDRELSLCDQQINDLQINQLQYLSSHNSYRMRTYEPLYDFIDKGLGLFSKYQQPANWDYTHESLEDQFNRYNIRSIELDVFYDPQGGHYYHRQGNRLIGEPTASGVAALNDPGFKILNQPDFDYMTHHYTFKDALQTVKKWSDAHPDHLPLTVIVEPKDAGYVSAITLSLNFLTKPKLITPTALDAIDTEIKEVFGENLKKVITPDDVRQEQETLEAAILTKGWPTLKEARGKILFLLSNSGFERSFYLNDHPSLQDRVMFTFSAPGKPECAFIKHKNPEKSIEEIQELVSKGYMVQTHADDAPNEAKKGEEDRREAAFASGAQIITTSYYRSDPRHKDSEDWTNYSVQFPAKEVAILNPISNASTMDCTVWE